MSPVVNVETCIACATCYEVCPAEPKVFEVTDVSRVINPEACIECGSCEDKTARLVQLNWLTSR